MTRGQTALVRLRPSSNTDLLLPSVLTRPATRGIPLGHEA